MNINGNRLLANRKCGNNDGFQKNQSGRLLYAELDAFDFVVFIEPDFQVAKAAAQPARAQIAALQYNPVFALASLDDVVRRGQLSHRAAFGQSGDPTLVS